jgi:hypothetical protein
MSVFFLIFGDISVMKRLERRFSSLLLGEIAQPFASLAFPACSEVEQNDRVFLYFLFLFFMFFFCGRIWHAQETPP